MNKTVLFILLTISYTLLFAGKGEEDARPARLNGHLTIDGLLSEEDWNTAQAISGFWQQFPTDSLASNSRTEIKFMYDDEFLYVGVRCYSNGNDFVITSLKRDYSFFGSDNITILFDTFNDKTNAFAFGINPYGVTREALVSNGGRAYPDFQVTWDNKWHGEASIHDTYWEAEMAIPFSTLRFQEGGTEWRFNAYRNDTQFNELSSWANIPRNRLIMDLAYMGKVVWEEPPGNAGSSVSLIPYTIGGVSRDYEDPASSKPKTTGNIGLDAKIGITSGLNLDLTVNPDFSQVEVDRQVTNLDRFEIFFPEKRQFFLENADLFSSFGLRHVNPFFSRRIGVARDTATGQNIQNPIHYGARLSGKINENLRVGLLNTQTAREVENGLPSFNYTVAALQQKVFNRSNISFIFANKQAFRPQESLGDFNTFNRVAGLEYRLASADNRWSGKAFYHHAFQPVQQEHPFTQGLQLEYQKRRYRAEWAHLLVGNGYNAEIGFVPRKDYMLLSPELQVFFFPRGGVVNTHSITADTRFFLQIGRDGNQIIAPWGLSERQTQVSWELQFIDNGRANITLTENDLTLLNDFDPTRLQDAGVFLAAGDKYHYVDISASYTSDFRRKISFTARPGGGQFYNGYRYGLAGAVTWRLQPLGSVALSWDYNHVNLADPFVPADILLVGPRFDFTFSKELFFTTFIQYNNQLDNLNVNARLQWRFAPVSDFFIVYTNNFLMDPFSQFSQFGERNQALVAKLTYWLNL